MSEEEETRERFDDKNGRDGVQLGVDYCISLPWPQDRPPDENSLGSFMREEEKKRESERFDAKNGRDRAQLGVDYCIPLPWPQDRPPDESCLRGFCRLDVNCSSLVKL